MNTFVACARILVMVQPDKDEDLGSSGSTKYITLPGLLSPVSFPYPVSTRRHSTLGHVSPHCDPDLGGFNFHHTTKSDNILREQGLQEGEGWEGGLEGGVSRHDSAFF